MVVRPGLTSIPILSSLPDIPLLYHSNPALSFLVDAMALSALFGTLLAPLGAQVLGRHDPDGKKAGKKFGAILGVILGLSSAFALRRAGISLFEYWLTTVIAALLIGGTLYMFLNKLLAGKYKIITGLVSFLIAWMVLDFWFVATGSETTRNIFGFVSLLTPIIVILYFLYIMVKTRGPSTPSVTPTTTTTPSGPGWFGRAMGGLGRGIGRLWGGVKRGARGIKDWWDALDRQEQITWKSIEEAGDGVVTAEADLDAIRRSWEALEEQTQASSAGLGFALEEGDRLKLKLTQNKPIDATKYKDTINDQLTLVNDRILKPAQKTLKTVGTVLNLKTKVESAIKDYSTLKAMINLSEVRAQVELLPDGPRKEEVRKAFAQVLAEVAKLDATLNRLDRIVKSLQDQHLPFFTNRAVEFQTFASDIQKRLDGIAQVRTALGSAVTALDKDQAADEKMRAVDAVQQLIQSFISALAQLEQIWTSVEDNTRILNEIRKGIDADLRQWKKIYGELVRPAIAAIEEFKETLKKALERSQAPPKPTPPPAPTPPKAPPAPAVAPPPSPAGEPVPTLTVIIQSIKEQRQVLVVLQTVMTKFVSEIEFTFKKPLMQKEVKTSEKAQEALKETASNAMEEAAKVAKFDQDAVQKAKDLAAELHAAAGDIANRLVLPGISQAEIKQLQALQANLNNFEKFEQGVLIPLIANTEDTVHDKALEAVVKGKTAMINADQLTKRVKDKLSALVKQFKQAIEWLTVEEATLTRALKRPPRAKPSGNI